MRNYKAETAWDAAKYKRLTFKVDRQQYAALTPAQQKTLSQRVRECIKEFLEGRVGE